VGSSAAAPAEPPAAEEAGPPGGWSRLYALVIGLLAFEIALLALLGRCFR
jgi:hypothetical protein